MDRKWLNPEMKKWIIAMVFPACLMMLPVNDMGFTPELRAYLALTVWGILAFAMNLLNNVITSMLLMFGYGLFGVCAMGVPFGVFSSEAMWITLAALILVCLIQRTTILERLAYTLSIRVGGSYMGIILAVGVFTIVARLLLQGALAGVAALAVAYGLCTALGYGKGKASAGVLLVATFVYLDANYFIYAPDYISIIYNAANEVTPIPVNYVSFFVENWVYIIPLLLSVIAVGHFAKPDNEVVNLKILEEKLQALGPWKPYEKRMLIVCIGLTAYLFTSRWHGLLMVYGFVVAVAVCFLPAMEIGKAEDLGKVNWGAWFFVGACMSIGIVGVNVGFGTYISKLALPYTSGMSNIAFLAFAYVLSMLLNFLMTPAAVLSLLGAPLTQICVDNGFSAAATVHMVYQGISQLWFSYEVTLYMIAFSFGMMRTKDFAKLMSVKFVIQTVFTFTIGFMWWRFIGVI